MMVPPRLVYAFGLLLIATILAVAGVFTYVGYAIHQNNRPLCRLTVGIEEVGTNQRLAPEVRLLNDDLD